MWAAGTVVVPFKIDDYTAWRLLEGLDDIALTLRETRSDRGFRGGSAGLETEDAAPRPNGSIGPEFRA